MNDLTPPPEIGDPRRLSGYLQQLWELIRSAYETEARGDWAVYTSGRGAAAGEALLRLKRALGDIFRASPLPGTSMPAP